MRIDRRALIDLSLKTLAEQLELADAGPPPPSHGVRLALKVLHMCSNGERGPFDSFWLQMRDDGASVASEQIASYCRATHLMTQLRGVMRAVGIEPNVASEQALHTAAIKVHPRGRSTEIRN